MKQTFLSILLTLVLTHSNHAAPIIKNLVFEGAGVRGIAYCGVLQELEQQGQLRHVEKVGGTSAGAIIATLIAMEYSAQEIQNIVSSTQFRKFNDGRFLFVGGAHRMSNRYGWYQGEKFKNWIAQLIEAKTNNADITFLELHQMGCKDLFLTATCLNKQSMVVLSYETYPNMKIKDAVRISMSIPLYFEAVFVDSNGQTYRDCRKGQSCDLMVDGGIVSNFPIHLFDQEIKSDSCKLFEANPFTLGIRIDDENQIEQDSINHHLAEQDITNLRSYISAFYVLIIEQLNRPQLSKDDWDRTVSVSSVGISPRIRRLSPLEKQKLVSSGQKATQAYLSRKR